MMRENDVESERVKVREGVSVRGRECERERVKVRERA